MIADRDPRAAAAGQLADDGIYSIDAQGAMGLQVGEGNTQIIYTFNRMTWTDGIAPPPLADVSGAIDSPYRGLSAFEERDAPFFFGREAAATHVLDRMSRHVGGTGLLVVSGVSGAGKSSLLRAGVLPRMRGVGLASAPGSASWPCLLFTPGHAPLDELAVRVASLAGVDAAAVRRGLDNDPAGFAITVRQAALAQSDRSAPDSQGSRPKQQLRLLLVIDQFEQLFTLCRDEQQCRAFITALHAAATTGHDTDQAPAAMVILGVRSDFEARCADYPELASPVQDRYLVTSMTERQLRMAITEPAKKASSRVDDDLVDILLRELSIHQHASSPAVFHISAVSSAGVLPLLSHALDQAWRSRIGDTLTVADYERTGGIEGAVADSAQRAYDCLTPTQQSAARQIFIRLTATSSSGVDTANRATLAELIEGKDAGEIQIVQTVLDAFAAQRLLTLAAGTVEISHEVVLTAWPLLRDTWLSETQADRIVRTRLYNVAAEWTRAAYDASYLYNGSLLEEATSTAIRIGADPVRFPPLNQTERKFLLASKRAQRRRARRRNGLIAFLMTLALGLASVAVVAFQARQDAIRLRDVAVSGQLISQSEALGDTDPTISRLKSLAAWRIDPSNEARYAMVAAAARPGITVLRGEPSAMMGEVASLAFSHDGKTLAAASNRGLDETVQIWDVATRQKIGNPLIHPSLVTVKAVAFSPDGKSLASGSDDGTVRIWDAATHLEVGIPLTGHADSVEAVAFSPDGHTVVSGSGDDTVRIWSVASRRQIGRPLTGHGDAVTGVAFSPDGGTLATSSFDQTARLWDVTTRRQIGRPLTGHGDAVTGVAFSPDGGTLATSSEDHTVRIWDVAAQRQVGDPLVGHTSSVNAVAFTPNGQVLVSGSDDHTARMWDVAALRRLDYAFTGLSDGVTSVALSPNGQTLASSSDRTVRLWDVASRRQIGHPLTGHTGRVTTVVFSPDGRTLATGSFDETVRLWDVATRRQIGYFRTGHTISVDAVAFSPDGKMLVSSSYDQTVRLWDLGSGRQIDNPLGDVIRGLRSVTFSPDGRTLAGGNLDGQVLLVDTVNRQRIGEPLTGHTGWVNSVAFSPDGKTLASSSDDETIRIWDVASHRQVGEPLTGHTSSVSSVAFSPDGKTLASSSDDETVRIWDVATQRQIGRPLIGHTGQVSSVVFSPDGRTLATGSEDRTVRLWNVGYVVDLVPYLCALAGGPLTRDDWALYVPPGPAYRDVCP